MQNKYIVISIGGSVLFPNESKSLDFSFFSKIKSYLKYLLSKNFKIVIVPGGFGGQYFFTDLRNLGCSEVELNHIGGKLIEIASIALGRYLKELKLENKNEIKVSSFHTLNDFQIGLETFDISVIGFTLTGASTSDSLSTLICSHIKGELLFLKNFEANKKVVEYVTDFDENTFSVDKFKEIIFNNKYPGQAGSTPLDYRVVEILKLTNLKTRVIYKEDLEKCENFDDLRIFNVII